MIPVKPEELLSNHWMFSSSFTPLLLTMESTASTVLFLDSESMYFASSRAGPSPSPMAMPMPCFP